MKRVLVTGGLGFIGMHLTEKLFSLGYNVRILDSERNASVNYDCEIIWGDIRNYNLCLQACKGVDAIFHTAGIASIRRALACPEEAYKVNVEGTENLIKAAIKRSVPLFVYSSSGKIYGNSSNGKSNENDEPLINSPYADTKYKAEILLRNASMGGNINGISLRYFSVYGPRQRLDYGILAELLEGTNGSSRPVVHADAGTNRDFTYIEDVINANIKCLEWPFEGYEVINIASGRTVTLQEAVDILVNITGKDIIPEYAGIKAGMCDHTDADISKAKKILGYQPNTTLEEGLRRTVKWLKKEQGAGSNVKVTAVLLTGGEGRRFKDAGLPKQFTEIRGKPLFIYSIETYESIAEVDEICLVINNDYKHIYDNLLRRYSFNKLGLLVKGGLFRQQSVRNALELITHDGLVVIQNGVNPMTPAHLIQGCIGEAYITGAATAYVPASHTVFEMNDQAVQQVLDRNLLGYTCDPQVYRVDVIKKALLQSKDEDKDIPTVDLVKRIGHPVGIVRSDETNIKLTTNEDLSIIRNLIDSRCTQ